MKFDASNMVGQQFIHSKFLKRQLASLYTVALMFMFKPYIYIYLLLLDRCYNSLRVLVRSTIVLHKSLSDTLLFQSLIFIFCKSILMPWSSSLKNLSDIPLLSVFSKKCFFTWRGSWPQGQPLTRREVLYIISPTANWT